MNNEILAYKYGEVILIREMIRDSHHSHSLSTHRRHRRVFPNNLLGK